MIRKLLKRTLLAASKRLSLFPLARSLTRNDLRILCYHGIAVGDVADFRPQLFIDAETFERRLAWLRRNGFPVLRLDDALARLGEGTLPPCATVLTIDDGFFSTFAHALPALRRQGMPATVYVTTYYAEKRTPIFRLLMQYIYWATRKRALPLDSLGIQEFTGTTAVGKNRGDDPVLWRLIDYGETMLDEPGRLGLATRLARALDVDIGTVIDTRALSLMTLDEIRASAAFGLDIQLHTHRHRFPPDEALASREVSHNRAVLEPLVGKRLSHLCYPSGVWFERHFPWLSEAGIESATTCEVGFNGGDTPRLALKRIFDGSHVSQLEFEAEVAGFLEIIRRARSWLTQHADRLFRAPLRRAPRLLRTASRSQPRAPRVSAA